MPDVEDELEELRPPTPERVAARALVLSAVACRGSIEKNSPDPGAEDLRQEVIAWLDSLNLAAELEDCEVELLSVPLGHLESEKSKDAGWKSEGLVVLCWALGHTNLPAVHEQCDPPDVANSIGFLEDRRDTPLENPQLLSPEEIDKWANVYLTLHWRLRQFSCEPRRFDFVKYVSECKWANLRLDTLEIIDNDLAINGIPIEKVEYRNFRNALSIVQERHQAFNWLLGFETLYSQITTDT